MKNKRFWRTVRTMFRDPVLTDINLFATSGAYYLFLSLGPLIVILLSIVPYTPLTEDQVLNLFLEFAPDAFRQLINTIISQVYATSFATLGLSLLVELWSAGKFFASLMRGIGEIYDGSRFAGFLRRRIFGAIFTLALILLIVASILLTLFGESLLQLVQTYIPPLEHTISLILRLHWPVFILGMTLINTLMFRYIPKRSSHFASHLPGAFLSAMGWLGFSQLFTILVDRFNFFSIYGSLAVMILSMFWIYCCLYIMFFGAWFNTWRIRLKNGAHPDDLLSYERHRPC